MPVNPRNVVLINAACRRRLLVGATPMPSYAARRRLLAYRPSAFVQGDTTAPGNINVTTVTATKVSRVVGKDSTDITFTADENFVEYMIRIVSTSTDTFTQGTLIEQATIASSPSFTTTLTDAEIEAAGAVEGNNLVKVFVKDAAGNWSS